MSKTRLQSFDGAKVGTWGWFVCGVLSTYRLKSPKIGPFILTWCRSCIFFLGLFVCGEPFDFGVFPPSSFFFLVLVALGYLVEVGNWERGGIW